MVCFLLDKMIKVVPLGAGQDVGRSCIIVTICGKNIMFDCGMHMGYQVGISCWVFKKLCRLFVKYTHLYRMSVAFLTSPTLPKISL